MVCAAAARSRPSIQAVPEPVDRDRHALHPAGARRRYQTTAELVADLERLDERRHIRCRSFGASTRRMVVGALGVFVALLGLTWWLARGPAPVVERPPVSILIADFDNKTGETVFDGALEQALSLGLEGASFIVAYPRGTAADVARRMGLREG